MLRVSRLVNKIFFVLFISLFFLQFGTLGEEKFLSDVCSRGFINLLVLPKH